VSLDQFSDVVLEAIRSVIEAEWDHTPVAWPNEEFEEPVEGNPWVAVEIFGASYAQQSIGMDEQKNNRWDSEGTLFLHVMIGRGRGASQSRGAAQALADLFRGRRLLGDALEFRDAIVGPGGPGDEEGNWYLVTVSVQWRHMTVTYIQV